MPRHSLRIVIWLVATGLLSGCSTVRMPNLDFVKFPEFLEEANNIKDYPKVSDAPNEPIDVRSATEWDEAAQELITKREGYERPYLPSGDVNVPQDVEALKAKVREYKLDDPK